MIFNIMEREISANGAGFRFLQPKVLWQSRNILYHLIKRDFLVTYKQTALGVLWALIKPLSMSLAIVFVFREMADFPDYGYPYILIAISALSIWEFFSSTIGKGSNSLVDERELITKISFPRIVIPMSSSVNNIAGLLINLMITMILMIFYQIPFLVNLLLIPFIYVLVIGLNLSCNLLLSTANVFYRDITNIVPFALRLGLFVSPVGFTLNMVPEKWQLLYSLNPLVGIIELMRYSILGEQFLPPTSCLVMSGITLAVLFFSSIIFFAKVERRFADVI